MLVVLFPSKGKHGNQPTSLLGLMSRIVGTAAFHGVLHNTPYTGSAQQLASDNPLAISGSLSPCHNSMPHPLGSITCRHLGMAPLNLSHVDAMGLCVCGMYGKRTHQ